MFIYLFLAALAFHCCMQAFSSCKSGVYSLAAVSGLLIAVASLVGEHGLWSMGSVVLVPRPSFSTSCGMLPDQELNLCPLHWQAYSYHWTTREGPVIIF